MMGTLQMRMIHPMMGLTRSMSRVLKGGYRDNLRPLTRGLEIDGKKTKPAVYAILKVDPVKTALWYS